MPPKRRNPRMSADEKAATTRAARKLAAEINEHVEELKQQLPQELIERRKRRNATARRRANLKRKGTLEIKRCGGMNMKGKPCKLPVLIKSAWDGDEEITGLYCLWHEPTITRDQRESFKAFGSSKRAVYRKVTPGEIAHELIQKSPQYFLRPYLRALGLNLTEDGELEEIGTGLKLHGFSRGGQVMRSRYPDLVGQVNIAEKLMDRIYGKARQAVDLASTSTSVSVSVTMDIDRVEKVAQVLAQTGLLPNGNGNGNGHIDSTAEDIPDATLED